MSFMAGLWLFAGRRFGEQKGRQGKAILQEGWISGWNLCEKGAVKGLMQRTPGWALWLLTAGVTLVVFLPTLRFPFFPFWDDDIHVHANPHLADLTWAGLGAFWAGPYQQLYVPLTYSVWAGLAVL